MITIDGTMGEGGGQILRSSLTLSALTGQPLTLTRIRAHRPKPGLQRQHLMAVQAAAQVCQAEITGAELGSGTITFIPHAPCAGDYVFDIGSAGSTTLVLQTVLPILLASDGPSQVRISGGTHNGMAPTVEFLCESFLPVLQSCGVSATIALERHGFHPAGGGTLVATIQPWRETIALDLRQRGKLLGQHAEVLLANLPAHIASREAEALKHGLHWSRTDISERSVAAHGPGNAIIARLRYTHVTTVFSAFGELRKPAEQVAQDCVKQVRRYAEHSAPVCEHLADQLLLPLACGGGGCFRTLKPSLHTRTNAAVIAAFLGEVVSMVEDDEGAVITIRAQSPGGWRQPRWS
jgi:RNA 3'-terminal phosphate cyclase (ATP)